MDAERSQKIADVLKETKTLGQKINKPMAGAVGAAAAAGLAREASSRLPIGTLGGTIMKYVLYVIAGLLAIGLILLGVDQWITPIFKRFSPSLPGIDSTQVFWTDRSKIVSITIGPSSNKFIPSSTVIQGQEQYAITMDILIKDEFPQKLPEESSDRIFFVLGSCVSTPKLRMSIDNLKNTVKVTSVSSTGPESAEVDNVPIHTPFRIGIVKTPNILEVYINGKLYKTRKLYGNTSVPIAEDQIIAPSNIKIGQILVSKGIEVMNLRTFGYIPLASEMASRMSDLTSKESFGSV